MPVIAVDIKSRRPYADGRPFADAGDYERIEGVLTCAVDPRNPANTAITDLQYAPVDDAGRVRFQSDFTLVAPADPSRGNGRLVVEVVNRGRRRTIAFFNRAPTPPIDSDAIPEGDGFLLRHGLFRAVHPAGNGTFIAATPSWAWMRPASARTLC